MKLCAVAVGLVRRDEAYQFVYFVFFVDRFSVHHLQRSTKNANYTKYTKHGFLIEFQLNWLGQSFDGED
jgi:hypothetical protein